MHKFVVIPIEDFEFVVGCMEYRSYGRCGDSTYYTYKLQDNKIMEHISKNYGDFEEDKLKMMVRVVELDHECFNCKNFDIEKYNTGCISKIGDIRPSVALDWCPLFEKKENNVYVVMEYIDETYMIIKTSKKIDVIKDFLLKYAKIDEHEQISKWNGEDSLYIKHYKIEVHELE